MKNNSGQSLLALVILIGGIITGIGITLAFSTGAFISSQNGYALSGIAESVATAGAEDGLLQLDRNVAFASSTYSFPVGSSTAIVSITPNYPSANFITILSQATVSGNTRKINVVVAENASTTQLVVTSWQEL